MKSLMLAIAMLLVSGQGFAGSLFGSSKCYDEKGKGQTKIVGSTVCKNGKGFKIPSTYDEREMVQIFKDGRPTGEYQYLEVYCFNNNFQGLSCNKFNKAKTGFNSSNKVTGTTVDGTWYPACSSTSVDPDGDSWGWENNKTCKVL